MKNRQVTSFTIHSSCLAAVMLALVMAATGARAAEKENGFKPIFNGKNLAGWDGNPKFMVGSEGGDRGRDDGG